MHIILNLPPPSCLFLLKLVEKSFKGEKSKQSGDKKKDKSIVRSNKGQKRPFPIGRTVLCQKLSTCCWRYSRTSKIGVSYKMYVTVSFKMKRPTILKKEKKNIMLYHFWPFPLFIQRLDPFGERRKSSHSCTILPRCDFKGCLTSCHQENG